MVWIMCRYAPLGVGLGFEFDIWFWVRVFDDDFWVWIFDSDFSLLYGVYILDSDFYIYFEAWFIWDFSLIWCLYIGLWFLSLDIEAWLIDLFGISLYVSEYDDDFE